ncbi:MAG: ABC-type transport auxiliary lipoprotein family protein [Pseudomonadota bacterium]
MANRVFLLPLALTVTACVSVLPEPETPEALYRIDVPVGAPRLATDVLIREPEAPRIFAGQAIASEGPDGGLKLVSGIEWADRSTQLLQDALIDAFDANGAGMALSSAGLSQADQSLEWRVVDLHFSDGQATCKLVVSLHDTAARRVVARDTISASITSRGRNNGARMSALKEAATNCVGQTADFIAAAQDNALVSDAS